MLFLRNVKVVCSSSNYRSVLQPFDFGIIPCFKQLYRKHIIQKLCAWWTQERMSNWKITVLQAIQITVADWQQVPQSTIVNSLCQCRCGHELNTQAYSESSTAKHYAFHVDWIYIGTGKGVDFRSCVSVDSELDECSICGFMYIVWWSWGWWEQWRRRKRQRWAWTSTELYQSTHCLQNC